MTPGSSSNGTWFDKAFNEMIWYCNLDVPKGPVHGLEALRMKVEAIKGQNDVDLATLHDCYVFSSWLTAEEKSVVQEAMKLKKAHIKEKAATKKTAKQTQNAQNKEAELAAAMFQ